MYKYGFVYSKYTSMVYSNGGVLKSILDFTSGYHKEHINSNHVH